MAAWRRRASEAKATTAAVWRVACTVRVVWRRKPYKESGSAAIRVAVASHSVVNPTIGPPGCADCNVPPAPRAAGIETPRGAAGSRHRRHAGGLATIAA
jgi:hypothetical protein